jgi:hypothetical protein
VTIMCMDNSWELEISNVLNPLGSQAREYRSTSESAGPSPSGQVLGQIGSAFRRTGCSISLRLLLEIFMQFMHLAFK